MERAPGRAFRPYDGVALALAAWVAFLPARQAFADLVAHLRRLAWRGDPEYWRRIFCGPAQEKLIESIPNYLALLAAYFTDGPYPSRSGWSLDGAAATIAQDLELLLFPLLALWTFIVLLRRVLSPRPPVGHMMCQPGFAACVAATTTLLGARSLEHWSGLRLSFWAVAASVGLAWASLAASRRWRPEPSWVDRLGRALGLAWIAVGCLSLIAR